MRKLFLFLLPFLIVTSCNDGDIIIVELEFDKELSLCGDINSDNYVLYVIKKDPYESLTLLFPVSTTNNLIFKPVDNPHTGSFSINDDTVRFNYRTYDANPLGELICQEIPSSTINIINDYPASSGKVNFTSTFEDDLDGKRTVRVVFTITDTNLGIINQDIIELGTYTWEFVL